MKPKHNDVTVRNTEQGEATRGEAYLRLPASGSAVLLGICLFFYAMPSLRAFGIVSIGDVFLVFAIILGGFERIYLKEVNFTPTSWRFLAIYLLITLLFLPSYIFHEIFPPEIEAAFLGALKTIEGAKLPDSATYLFSGSRSQGRLFFLFVFNLTLVPVLLWLIRIKDLAEWRFLWACWTCGVLCGALIAILHCNGFLAFVDDRSWVLFRRARGLTGHPNILAAITMLGLPGLLAMLDYRREFLIRCVAMVGIILLWFTIDYSRSRSSTGGFFAIIGLFWVMKGRNLNTQYLRGITITLLGFVAWLVISVITQFTDQKIGGALGRLTRGSFNSDHARTAINTEAFSQAMDNPLLGVGYQLLKVAHNIFLQIWQVGGIFALVGYIMLICLPLGLLLRLHLHSKMASLGLALFAYFVCETMLLWTKSNPADLTYNVLSGLVVYLGIMAFSRGKVEMPLVRSER